MNFTETHPFSILALLREDLRTQFGPDAEADFNFTIYCRDLGARQREEFSIQMGDDKEHKEDLQDVLRTLPPNFELGFNNYVVPHVLEADSTYTYGSRLYVPVIDFLTSSAEAAHGTCHALCARFAWLDAVGYRLYFTGRSFHAYWPTLISAVRYNEFVAHVLLANAPTGREGSDLTDTRWVGRSIQRGYGCLRWTARGNHSLQEPMQHESQDKFTKDWWQLLVSIGIADPFKIGTPRPGGNKDY